MTREQGIFEIENALWIKDSFGSLVLTVTAPADHAWKGHPEAPVYCYLSMRPVYCDRGHIQLIIDGPLNLDGADAFPRFFFSFEEADLHVRTFLKWRLWKKRTTSYADLISYFGVQSIAFPFKEELDDPA